MESDNVTTTEIPGNGTDMYNYTYDANGTESPLCLLNIYCETMEDYFDRMEDYIYPEPFEWGLIVVYIITFFIGLIGNSLVCFAIWRNKKMRTITNIFIVNLSVADLGVIIICLPSTLLVDVTETWFLGTAFCKIHLFLMTVSVSVSVMTLCAISVERWYAICHPLNFHSTVRRARLIIATIWFLSICVAIPELVSASVERFREDTVLLSACFPKLWTDKQTAIFQIFLMVALYCLPMCLMGFTYTHIALVLWTEHIPGTAERQSRQPMMGKQDTDQTDNRKKAAKMLVAVVIVFGLCFFPVHLLNILRYTVGLHSVENVNILALFAHWATFLNSCINPVIYNFMSEKFRKEFKHAIRLCARCGKSNINRRQSDFYRVTYNSGYNYSTRYNSHFPNDSRTITENISTACVRPTPNVYLKANEKFRKEFKHAIRLCARCGKSNINRRQSDFYRVTYNSGYNYSTRFNSHFTNDSRTITENISTACVRPTPNVYLKANGEEHNP